MIITLLIIIHSPACKWRVAKLSNGLCLTVRLNWPVVLSMKVRALLCLTRQVLSLQTAKLQMILMLKTQLSVSTKLLWLLLLTINWMLSWSRASKWLLQSKKIAKTLSKTAISSAVRCIRKKLLPETARMFFGITKMLRMLQPRCWYWTKLKSPATMLSVHLHGLPRKNMIKIRMVIRIM